MNQIKKEDFNVLVGKVISRTPYQYCLITKIKNITKYHSDWTLCYEGISLYIQDNDIQIETSTTECIDIEDIEKFVCYNNTIMNEKLNESFKIIQNLFNKYGKK